MASIFDLPLDVLDLISIRGGLFAWLALSTTCRRFSKLLYGVHKMAILDKLVEHKIRFRPPASRAIGWQ